MPKGTRHELVGLLLEDGGHLTLRVDDGGHWRLEAPRRVQKLVGRRVEVIGLRDGFDLLSVKSAKAL